MPAIYALYVINKSGGLIYNKVIFRWADAMPARLSLHRLTDLHCCSDLAFKGFLCISQEFVVMASNNLNDTLRLASIW